MPLADRTLIFDNSAERAALVADLQPGVERIIDEVLYAAIRSQIREADHGQE